MIRSHRLASLPLLLLPLLFAIGCGTRPSGTAVQLTAADTAGGPVKGDWVLIHALSDPENLNPIISSDAGAQEIDSYVYETLLITHPLTLKALPWIADTLPTLSPDKLIYDYRLRRNAKFSDGTPVTGEDFIFCLKIIKNPDILDAAPTRSFYERVDSAMLVDNDPYHLRIVMREPYFLGENVTGGLYALPRHVWDPKNISASITFHDLNDTLLSHDSSDEAKPRKARIKEMADAFVKPERSMDPSFGFLIGSGPYRIREMRRNTRVVLERNPEYWNRENALAAAYPERLMWMTINDYNAALVSLRAGELDLMPKMEKVQYRRIRDKLSTIGLQEAVYDYPAYNYVGYNADRPIFSDPGVRRALAYAINRQAIVDKIYFGMARPVQSPIFYKRADYDSTLPTIPFNLDSARALLTEAGWKDSDGDGVIDKTINGTKTPFRFTISLNSGNQARQQMGILIVSDLKKLGIDASTTSLDWSIFLKRMDEGDFDAYIGGWVMGVEEGDLTQIWHSKSAVKGGSNYVKFRNREVDSLLDLIKGEFTPERRQLLLTEVQRIIHREQPYNFLVSEKLTGAYSGRFQDAVFFAPRPCYNAGWWWVPSRLQRYSPALASR